MKHARTWKEEEKFFGFFWSTSYTHDDFELNSEGDAAVLEFLKSYQQSGASNNTVLMVISDHGLRWGAFRETYQGRLEEHLPLLMFVLPDWFKRRYRRAVSNLRCNRGALTTHFDLHYTLLDLVHLEHIEDDVIATRQQEENRTRGRSLFLQMQVNRTCRDAGIPISYCTCSDQVEHLDKNDTRSWTAATSLLDFINGLLKDTPKCAQLAIENVKQSFIEMGGSLAEINNSTSRLVVTVELKPGGGLFEGALQYHDDADAYNEVETVSRINEYGSQSHCVEDAKLKLYCYCRD
jgi:hypothetical protein